MNDVLECLDEMPPDKLDTQLIEDRDIVTDWLNDLLDLHIESEKLSERLQDGIILCKLTQTLASSARQGGGEVPPPGVRRYHQRCLPDSIQARDNVASFCTWCMVYEIPPVLILSPEDVSLNRNTPALVSLLIFLLRKTGHFEQQGVLSRCSSISSTGSYSERVNKRRLSRGKSVDLFEVMSQRRSSIFRTRSLSVDSEGSVCSAGSPLRSPTSDTNETIIKDLNLACRNINKKVSKVDTSMKYDDTSFTMDKSQVGESQASLRRKSRALVKSLSVEAAGTQLCNHGTQLCNHGDSRKNVSITPMTLTQKEIFNEKLTLDDLEYLLLSNSHNVSTRMRALYKLLAVRLLERRCDPRSEHRVNGTNNGQSDRDHSACKSGVNGTKLDVNGTSYGINGTNFSVNGTKFGVNGTKFGVNGTKVDVTDVSKEMRLYPVLDLTPLPVSQLHNIIRSLKSFIIREVSDNRDVTFGELLKIWNR